MKKEDSKNWAKLTQRNILRWGKIARQQRLDHVLSANSSAQIKCEQCDEKITVDKTDYKEKWVIFFRKGQVEKDENDGYSFRTRVEFYCVTCQK